MKNKNFHTAIKIELSFPPERRIIIARFLPDNNGRSCGLHPFGCRTLLWWNMQMVEWECMCISKTTNWSALD